MARAVRVRAVAAQAARTALDAIRKIFRMTTADISIEETLSYFVAGRPAARWSIPYDTNVMCVFHFDRFIPP